MVELTRLFAPQALEQVARALLGMIARHGQPPLRRLIEGVESALGRREATYSHPLQRPELLYFPGLSSQAWYAAERYPLLEKVVRALEAAYPAVRAEYSNMPSSSHVPYVRHSSEKFRDLRDDPSWSALFLRRHDDQSGVLDAEVCPATAGLLRELAPYLMAGGEAFFSVLEPGATLPPHHDATNCKLTVHLGIDIPPDCGIRVGEEVRTWREGGCLVFDDTFRHEAWNFSSRRRVVFIVDVWHPELSEVEVEAITALVAAVA